MALYEKYRPRQLKTFFGNEDLKADLQPFVKGTRPMPHAVLLSGPSGCGKTTLARILARISGASPHDINELDTADFRGIDSIRDIRRQMYNAPLGGDTRVWILDECHKLTNDAQNALLKALESPPQFVKFFLCTTDPQLLVKTILTRCTQFSVEALAPEDLLSVLQRACKGEGAEIPDKTLKIIVKQSNGSARAALSSLERVLGRAPEDYDKAIENYQDLETKVIDLCRALLQKRKWADVAKILKGIKEEPESVRRAILGYMNSVLLSGKDSAQAAMVLECFKDPYFNTGFAGLSLSCYTALLVD